MAPPLASRVRAGTYIGVGLTMTTHKLGWLCVWLGALLVNLVLFYLGFWK